MARLWKNSDFYLHKITTIVLQTMLIGEGRAVKVRTFTKVGFERAAGQYEQAAKDEIQVAVADTIEHARADLISQLVRIEQDSRDKVVHSADDFADRDESCL